MFVDIYNTDKKYQIIYADPAWKFNSKQIQNNNSDKSKFNSLDMQYETTNTNIMAKLNIKLLVNQDCALFMWTTDAHLQDALFLIKSWGFSYKTIAFVWLKTDRGTIRPTVGAWTMKNCEICLLATKGKMLKYKKANNIQQFVKADRKRHSQKPSVIRENIVKLFGNLPRIELFARQQVDGWDCWGNEVEEVESEN